MMLVQGRVNTSVVHKRGLVCELRFFRAPIRTFRAGECKRAKIVPTSSVFLVVADFLQLCFFVRRLPCYSAGDDSWCI